MWVACSAGQRGKARQGSRRSGPPDKSVRSCQPPVRVLYATDNRTASGRFLAQNRIEPHKLANQAACGFEISLFGCEMMGSADAAIAKIAGATCRNSSDQLFGGNSAGVFCLPVPNSKIL